MFRMPGASFTDALPVAELDEVLHEMLGCASGIGAKELPMEMQVRHHASLSLSNLISIIGAMRSYNIRYVASLIGMSTPSLPLISCTHFTA